MRRWQIRAVVAAALALAAPAALAQAYPAKPVRLVLPFALNRL